MANDLDTKFAPDCPKCGSEKAGYIGKVGENPEARAQLEPHNIVRCPDCGHEWGEA